MINLARRRIPAIKLKSPAEIAAIRAACLEAAQTLDLIAPAIQPGVTTGEIDRLCHAYIVDGLGSIPAPLNYRGYPKSICTSVNAEVCHGIPSNRRKLREGDIVNVDVTVIKDGWHGDTSRMFRVGKVSGNAHRVCEVAYECMVAGIRAVRPGAPLSHIGRAIEKRARERGCSVVREYGGHGIGRTFHEEPSVLNYEDRLNPGPALEVGMTFTIEPMVNLGTASVRLLDDGWTVTTRDGKLSAQWEHTIAVAEDGFDVLTLPPGASL